MNSKLTPKENYLRIAHGEIPESIPIYTMGFPGRNGETPVKMIGPSLFNETHIKPMPQGMVDVWGVRYIANEETNFACIPEPNNFILDDVTKWRDVIKRPTMPEHIDWEMMAKKDIADANIDRTQSAAMAMIGLMPFQQFIAFMGFSEGLMAFFEEPDEVKELLNFLADTYLPIVQATVDYYDPDLIYLLDDTAANHTPFISPAMFKEFMKPIYDKLTKPAVERGIPVQFHNCGRCEDLLDDMYDIGTRIWDPAQPTNDLLAVKAKFGRKLAMAGCYQWTPPVDWDTVDEESTRQEVRDVIDRYAPNGGFIYSGGAFGRFGDERTARVNSWISDESYNYCQNYYTR